METGNEEHVSRDVDDRDELDISKVKRKRKIGGCMFVIAWVICLACNIVGGSILICLGLAAMKDDVSQITRQVANVANHGDIFLITNGVLLLIVGIALVKDRPGKHENEGGPSIILWTISCVFLVIFGLSYYVTQMDLLIDNNFPRTLSSSIESNYGLDEEFTRKWDKFQKKYECCGPIDGPDFWLNSSWFTRLGSTRNMSIPRSCCVNFTEIDVTKCNERSENYTYNESCQFKIRQHVECFTDVWAYLVVGLGLVQIPGVLLLYTLSRLCLDLIYMAITSGSSKDNQKATNDNELQNNDPELQNNDP